jgi:pSer/pThr/pTyr-binding forkhead associated (FHA) protein
MSVSLILRSAAHDGPGGEPPTLTFDGTRVVLGRGPGCDMRLPDPSVSHRHASVRASGSDYTLVDEGSTNGTFVGGVKLTAHMPRTLRSGDLVRIGRVWLEVRFEQRPPTLEPGQATRDLALALVADAMNALGGGLTPRVRVVEGLGPGGELALAEEGRVYVVGRGEGCDLLLDDPDVSRQHVELVRRAQTVLLRDLGAKNMTSLGDAPISVDRALVWRPHLMLRVGSTVLCLDEPVAAALAELEQADDEHLPPSEAPPLPTPAPATNGPSAFAPPSGPASGGAAAPIVGTPERAPIPGKRRPTWSGTDLAVIVAALGILALSIAGLYWLLRG